MANKYITSDPSDYSNTRIPSLSTISPNGTASIAYDNTDKAKAIAETFFPPPPEMSTIPASVYPEPTKPQGIFTHKDIHRAINKLKPHKAPGVNGIRNVVLQKCANTIIDYIYYIYWAIPEFSKYPQRWLIILTIIL